MAGSFMWLTFPCSSMIFDSLPVCAAFTAWPFIVLAIGILFIILAIAVLRFHPFIALMLAAILVGVLATSLPGDENRNHVVNAIELSMVEFGSTAGKIAWVIGLAAIIGLCLMESGAADRIVRGLVRTLGEKRAGWAMMIAAFFLSIPVFFDTVFFLIIPLALALAFRLGKRYLLFCNVRLCGRRHYPWTGSSHAGSAGDGRYFATGPGFCHDCGDMSRAPGRGIWDLAGR